MHSETDIEKRVRRLEEAINRLRDLVANQGHKLGQVAEDNWRDVRPLPRGTGVRFFHAQVVAGAGIGGTVGNLLGGGEANILQILDGHLYQNDPVITVPVINDTGGTIDEHTYLCLVLEGGVYTIVVADCATVDPEPAPAPPE